MHVRKQMAIGEWALTVALVFALSVPFNAEQQPQTGRETSSPSYEQLITAGYRLVKEQKATEGYAAALHALSTDPQRFEAYALAALALHLTDAKEEATTLIARALELAPNEKKPAVSELASAIASGVKSAGSTTKTAPPKPAQTAAARRPAAAAAVRAGGVPTTSKPAAPRQATRVLRVADSSLGYVNIRKGPAADAPIVGRVRPGDVYNFSSVSNGWYKIDGKGWIAGKYVAVQ